MCADGCLNHKTAGQRIVFARGRRPLKELAVPCFNGLSKECGDDTKLLKGSLNDFRAFQVGDVLGIVTHISVSVLLKPNPATRLEEALCP